MNESPFYSNLDLQETLANNRLISLWRLMGGFRMVYITAILSLALATAAKTATYLLLRYFVDDVLLADQTPVPYYLIALGFVGLAVFEGGFTFLSGRLAARASEGITLRLRNYLFDHLQRLPVAYHDQTKTGELVQRCSSDVDELRRFFAEQAIGFGRIVLLFGVNFAVLLSLNVRLALFGIVLIPIVVIFSFFFFRRVYQAYEAYQEQEGGLSSNLQENLAGVRVVKAFARQPFEITKFEESNWGQYQKGRWLVIMHGLYWPMTEGLCLFQWLLVKFLGALMVLDGSLSLGTYLAFIGLFIWIIFPIQNLGRLIVNLSHGIVSYQRIADIIQEKQEQVTPNGLVDSSTNGKPADASFLTLKKVAPPTGNRSQNGQPKNGPIRSANGQVERLRGELIFDNVSLTYGETAILQNISFAVKPGQTVAVLGPTGAGKSSLVNLLPRFYDYTNGQIWLDGQPLRQYHLTELRQQIGIVEQEPFLFSRTIRENIAYGVHQPLTQAEIEAAAQAAAIHEVILTFPQGYDTLVGERGVTLSGGQKQRLAIARTLLKSPSILIFDDAVSAVDTETEHLIQAALEALRRQRTTFIIAHRIQTVMRADKILVLDRGRIVQQGIHAELIQQAGIYRQIYDLQAKIDQEL